MEEEARVEEVDNDEDEGEDEEGVRTKPIIHNRLVGEVTLRDLKRYLDTYNRHDKFEVNTSVLARDDSQRKMWCKPCDMLKYLRVPSDLLKSLKGTIDKFGKLNLGSTRLWRSVKEHEEHALHQYGLNLYRDMEITMEKDRSAGLIVLTNAYYVLKEGGLGEKFAALNSKDDELFKLKYGVPIAIKNNR